MTDDEDQVSQVDDRQPFHVVDGKVLTQSEWRLKVIAATELFDAFKQQAYRDGEI